MGRTERFLEKQVLPRFAAVKDWIEEPVEDENEPEAAMMEEGVVGGQPEHIEMVQPEAHHHELPHHQRSSSVPRNFRPKRFRKNQTHPQHNPSASTNENTSDVTWIETFFYFFGLFIKVIWQMGTNCYSLDFMALLFCLGVAQLNLDALNYRFLARDLHTETDIFRPNLFVPPVFDFCMNLVDIRIPGRFSKDSSCSGNFTKASDPARYQKCANEMLHNYTMADVSFTKTQTLRQSLNRGSIEVYDPKTREMKVIEGRDRRAYGSTFIKGGMKCMSIKMNPDPEQKFDLSDLTRLFSVKKRLLDMAGQLNLAEDQAIGYVSFHKAGLLPYDLDMPWMPVRIGGHEHFLGYEHIQTNFLPQPYSTNCTEYGPTGRFPSRGECIQHVLVRKSQSSNNSVPLQLFYTGFNRTDERKFGREFEGGKQFAKWRNDAERECGNECNLDTFDPILHYSESGSQFTFRFVVEASEMTTLIDEVVDYDEEVYIFDQWTVMGFFALINFHIIFGIFDVIEHVIMTDHNDYLKATNEEAFKFWYEHTIYLNTLDPFKDDRQPLQRRNSFV